ncbi:MAG: hypothetical protein O7B99_05450 [Planctomycetota bacterium]|nr:hypothetical protein [Planctomycetota bacterium]
MNVRLAALALGVLPVLALQEPKKEAAPPVPEVGKLAPSFRLNDHNGRAVEVGGKSERWTVVAFFPKAATPG